MAAIQCCRYRHSCRWGISLEVWRLELARSKALPWNALHLWLCRVPCIPSVDPRSLRTPIATLRQAMDEQQTTMSVAVKLVDLQMEVGETSQARQTVARAREKFPNDVEDLRRMAAKVDYVKHVKLAGEHTYR